jgi:hypothetical protein
MLPGRLIFVDTKSKVMNSQSFHCTITSGVSAVEASERINRVWDWWTKSFEGASARAGDTFSVRFGKTFVSFRVAEMLPGKKTVWDVTDSYLDWLDKREWNGTRIIFEITTEGGKTHVTMTHEGLVPQIACYEDCREGWTFYVEKSLQALLSTGKGLADRKYSTDPEGAAASAAAKATK